MVGGAETGLFTPSRRKGRGTSELVPFPRGSSPVRKVGNEQEVVAYFSHQSEKSHRGLRQTSLEPRAHSRLGFPHGDRRVRSS